MGSMHAGHRLVAAHMAMAARPLIDLGGLLPYVAAWSIMMVAMMLPSALPMVVLYRRVRGDGALGRSASSTLLFTAGYLAVWAAIALPLYSANQLLTWALSVDPRLNALAPYGTATVLAIAGLYQFTPLKEVCLRSCRSPLTFLMQHWQSGIRGTLRLSVRHALYCGGCCWGLMAVLVVAGAMSFLWAITISALVFVEKLLPAGPVAGRGVGAVLLALGATVLIRPELSEALSGVT